MTISCASCALNMMGYCTVYNRSIPRDKEAVPHQCDRWKMQRSGDPLAIVDGLMNTHEEHKQIWWCLYDMIKCDATPLAGERLAVWRLIWTAPYIDDATRILLATAVPQI